MALFSVEISDADVPRVLAAIAANYRRPEQVPNPDYVDGATIPNPDFSEEEIEGPENSREIPDPANAPMTENPESTPQFANRMVREFLLDNVRSFEVSEAKRQAAQQASENVNSVSISDPAV